MEPSKRVCEGLSSVGQAFQPVGLFSGNDRLESRSHFRTTDKSELAPSPILFKHGPDPFWVNRDLYAGALLLQ